VDEALGRVAAHVVLPVDPRQRLAQGFDHFDEARPSVLAMGTLLGKAFYAAGIVSVTGHANAFGGRRERGSEALHASLLRWVDAAPGKPWFAYVQAMEPHEPYRPARADAEAFGFPAGEDYAVTPPHGGLLPFHPHPDPDPALLAKLLAQYDGEIRGWSRSFGALVEALRARGRLADTVVVFVSDHGEEFHEHGGWTHGHSLHRELTQVPLVVRLPDALGERAVKGRGRVIHGTTTLLDVAPTLLELCGVRYPRGDEPGRPGESLVPQLLGEAGRPSADNVPGNRRILAEVTQQQAKLRAMRDGRWMVVHAEEPFREATQLFDDVSDPRHRRDRAAEQTVELRDLRLRMREFFRQLEAIALTGRARDIDPETLEALRGLGYVK
jgi:arylsulfatase A-like enzyme